jgi:hypothetical protein
MKNQKNSFKVKMSVILVGGLLMLSSCSNNNHSSSYDNENVNENPHYCNDGHEKSEVAQVVDEVVEVAEIVDGIVRIVEVAEHIEAVGVAMEEQNKTPEPAPEPTGYEEYVVDEVEGE